MKPVKWLILLGILSLLVLLATPFIGMQIITPGTLWSAEPSSMDVKIFWHLRVPRTIMAFLVGSALALSGLAFQAMFSNPLATPYTLGVAGGAALGAALYIRIGVFFSLLGISGQTFCAFGGAVATILLVHGLSRLRQSFSMAAVLLAGVAISFFCSSLILFIQYISGFTHLFQITRWLMGELAVTGFSAVREVGPVVLCGAAIIFCLGKELNLLATGEELAISRGLNLRVVKNVLFFATSLMVGVIVARCGPIGFVGMMAPHICRLLVGADHRVLIPASFLFGGCFLTLCDTLARVLIAPAEMPVGVITALLGGPFFVWLLVSDGLGRNGLQRSDGT
ncbi:MAG: iron ABC transporter permease [Planctomycetota bacterium]|jgi:iron complex transport system permease protein|nr:iron ABC transporter permease [Planctomycetota bacterium]